MATTQFNASTSQAAAAALNAASSTGFNLMELAYNRQRQQMLDTDARTQEQRRITESDRAFQAEQQQAGIANSQRERALQLEANSQAFTESKYKDLKVQAEKQAAEVRRVTSALGLPPMSDTESLQVVTSLLVRKDAQDLKQAELKDTTALRAGILEAGRISDPAARMAAIRNAFANNPNAKVDEATMKHSVTLVNRDRLMVNQAVFDKIATAGNINDLRAVQSLPGFSEWFSDEANRSVWKDRFSELDKLEPKGKTRDVIKISSDGTTLWDNGVPAVKVEDRQVRDANGKLTPFLPRSIATVWGISLRYSSITSSLTPSVVRLLRQQPMRLMRRMAARSILLRKAPTPRLKPSPLLPPLKISFKPSTLRSNEQHTLPRLC